MVLVWVDHSLTFLIDDPSTLYRLGGKWMSVNVRPMVYWVSKSFSSQRVCIRGRRSFARTYTK